MNLLVSISSGERVRQTLLTVINGGGSGNEHTPFSTGAVKTFIPSEAKPKREWNSNQIFLFYLGYPTLRSNF